MTLLGIDGDICKKVRSIIVQILKQHKLTNNFDLTGLYNNPHKKKNIGDYTISVFEISKPTVDKASFKTKDIAHYNATGVGIEYFPERLIGALVDLYVLYFALTNTKIPNKYGQKEKTNILAAWENSSNAGFMNEQAFGFINIEKKNETGKEENTSQNTTVDNAEDGKAVVGEATGDKAKVGDELDEEITNYLATAWFYDLVRKKEYSRLRYKEQFNNLETKNKNFRINNNNKANMNDRVTIAENDKRNAKIFILAQIKEINDAVYNSKGVVRSSPSNDGGGIRKTKKNKNSKKRRKNKTTRRKRNTKRNKR